MTYVSILQHVEPGDEAAPRLELGCALAARFDAMLIGLGAAQLEAPVIDPTGFVAIDAELIAADRKHLETEFKDIERQFRAAAAIRTLRIEWRSELEFPADVIARHARAADLVIVGRGASAATISPQHAASAGDVLMQVGRPTLVVPPGVSDLRLDHVVIAWRNGREAQRAVADAIPLLKLATKVSVVAICDEDQTTIVRGEVEDVTAFLVRHNIGAKHEIRRLSGESIADGLIRFAGELRSDLIVAGAYGHGRLREWIFGGVTRDLLNKSPIACLFSH